MQYIKEIDPAVWSSVLNIQYLVYQKSTLVTM